MKKTTIIVLLFIALSLLAFSSYASCLNINSQTTDEFFNEIPSINSQLPSCNLALPSPLGLIFGNSVIEFRIAKSSSIIQNFYLVINNKKISALTTQQRKPSFYFYMSDCTMTRILSSANRFSAFAYAYKQNKVALGGVGWWNAFKIFSVRPILSLFFGRAAEPVSLSCENYKKPGELCSHGGECTTGNCVAVAPGSRTSRCSCDPMHYVPPQSNGECPPGSKVRS